MVIKRSLVREVLSKSEDGLAYSISIEGWVSGKRNLKDTTFLTITDRSGCIQVLVPNHQVSTKIGYGDVVKVVGCTYYDDRAPGGVELRNSTVSIIAKCEGNPPVPLDKMGYRQKPDISTRLNYRYLDLRDPKIARIFKLKSATASFLRKHFEEEDFIEINTPKIVATATEGGSNLFPVEYFNEDAFLAQSPQFYKQMMMASGFERVYEIAPAFRAEKHGTPRHLNEFISVDAEMAFIDSEEDVMRMEENLLAKTMEDLKKCLDREKLGINIEVPKTPFPRITMEKAYDILHDNGIEVSNGDDIPTEGEEAISKYFRESEGSQFVFLTKFPILLRPAYSMPDTTDTSTTRTFDLLFNGLEITSGGQRVHNYEQLKAALETYGKDSSQFGFYLDAFRYGMPPHSGFGLGLDRFVAQLVGADNVCEAVLFPRTSGRLIP